MKKLRLELKELAQNWHLLMSESMEVMSGGIMNSYSKESNPGCAAYNGYLCGLGSIGDKGAPLYYVAKPSLWYCC